MGSRFPIAISRAMATPAQRRAFREFQLPAITRLEKLQIGFVMAVVAKVVAIVTPVTHDNIRMFLGNDQIVFVIESQRRRLILLVTRIAIEIRKVGLGRRELAIRNPGGCVAGNRTVDQGNRRQRRDPAPCLCEKCARQRNKCYTQSQQNNICLTLVRHSSDKARNISVRAGESGPFVQLTGRIAEAGW